MLNDYDNFGNKLTDFQPDSGVDSFSSANLLPPDGLIGDSVSSPTSPTSIISGSSVSNLQIEGVAKVGVGDDSAGLNQGSEPSDIVFWAGASQDDRATAPFRVDLAGNLTAQDATIRGKLIAESTPLLLFAGEASANYTIENGAAGTTTVALGHINMALTGTAAGGSTSITSGTNKLIDWSEDAIFEFEFKMSVGTLGTSGAANGSQTWYLFVGDRDGSEEPTVQYIGLKLTATEGNAWTVTTITKDASTEESKSITMTTTNINNIRAEFDTGSQVRFYLNDVLKTTHSTNIPSTTGHIMTLKGGVSNDDTGAVTMEVGKFTVYGKGSF